LSGDGYICHYLPPPPFFVFLIPLRGRKSLVLFVGGVLLSLPLPPPAVKALEAESSSYVEKPKHQPHDSQCQDEDSNEEANYMHRNTESNLV
jgi:hypothetical protein